MSDATITLSDKRPAPPRADFAFEIDFKRGVGPASRVFTATHDFIRACEALDAELVKSIDSSIETVLVLEDIQEGSIRTYFRSTLEAVDDDALKTLDWKPQVGKYLVKAKYALLRWTDTGGITKSLPDLREEIRQIAAETDVRHLPDYSPPSSKALVAAAVNFQSVKDRLVEGDRAFFRADGGETSEWEFNLSVRMPVESIEDLAVARTITMPPAEMILPVKKPDYLGDSRWQLRHGARTIEAKIEHVEWLKQFQNREVDVRPGDALRCIVAIENLYGHDNELLTERFSIKQVLGVLLNRYVAPELPFGGKDEKPA